jgi:hypothetical protein
MGVKMGNPIDQFLYDVLCFLGELHDCHKCKYVMGQVSMKGKRRIFCDKYKQAVKRVQWQCIDRFIGFNSDEINEIERQYKAGKCMLVIDGVAV